MTSLQQLAGMTNLQLERISIAAKNLACAAGLPGTEGVDPEACLKTVSEWSEKVAWKTRRSWKLFERCPSNYHGSRDYFRMLCLVTTLQRDCGVRYNPAKMPENTPFEPCDSFIFGAMRPGGGTCASMPVLVAAVGRQLGYPLRLAAARTPQGNHLFVRWVAPDDTYFNIEATANGLFCPPNSCFQKGRYIWSPAATRYAGYLLHMTPRQELAAFLMQRYCHWYRLNNHRESSMALGWAAGLAPEFHFYRDLLHNTMKTWLEALEKQLPPGFPPMAIKASEPAFSSAVPAELSRHFHTCSALEHMLADADQQQRFWGPMRRGAVLSERPDRAQVEFKNGRCKVMIHTRKQGFSGSSMS